MTPEMLREKVANAESEGVTLTMWWVRQVLTREKRDELMHDGYEDWCETFLAQTPDDEGGNAKLMVLYARYLVEQGEDDET